MTTQEAYEGMREFFSRPEAVPAKSADACHYRFDPSKVPAGYDPDMADKRVAEAHYGAAPLRCAFGCLIPDELYRPEMEGVWALALIEGGQLGTMFDEADDNFIAKAQRLHDDYDTVTAQDFVRKLDWLAKEFGLEVIF